MLSLLFKASKLVNPIYEQRLQRQPGPENSCGYLAEIDVIDGHVDIGWKDDDEKKYEEI